MYSEYCPNKVAPEFTAKGYCSTKNMYYQGMKLHALVWRRPGSIPFPESIFFSSADVNDLTAFKEAFGETLVFYPFIFIELIEVFEFPQQIGRTCLMTFANCFEVRFPTVMYEC
jgi:hypothetical protein